MKAFLCLYYRTDSRGAVFGGLP